MRTAVVVPTNRPERLARWLDAWREQFACPDIRVIVVEDAPEPTFEAPGWAEHYAWADIDADLGKARECITRRSGGCRDYGFWLAGQDQSIEMVVSLDDDVAPDGGDLLARHWQALEARQMSRWYSPTPFPCRGLPYRVRAGEPAVLNHGLWSGVPDIDAFDQLSSGERTWYPHPEHTATRLVPAGLYYPMSIMNVAVRREHVRYLWMPVLPEGCKRWDDIWSGLVFKRLADLYGWNVVTGGPCVNHTRASNVVNNLRQEMLGYGINERAWQVLETQWCRGDGAVATWRAIWHEIGVVFPELRETARLAAVWADLWDGETGR